MPTADYNQCMYTENNARLQYPIHLLTVLSSAQTRPKAFHYNISAGIIWYCNIKSMWIIPKLASVKRATVPWSRDVQQLNAIVSKFNRLHFFQHSDRFKDLNHRQKDEINNRYETYRTRLEKVRDEQLKICRSIWISWSKYRVCILDDIIVNELVLLPELWGDTTQISTVNWWQRHLISYIQRRIETARHTQAHNTSHNCFCFTGLSAPVWIVKPPEATWYFT